MAQKTVYRTDLDGLRGLAILGVVIYHIFIGKVSGGVDIFLFLSGFFFLGSQVRSAVSDTGMKIWQHIIRVLRRLWPGMIVVLSAVGILSTLILPLSRVEALLPEFRDSLLFWENWQLVSQGASYASAGQSVSPLQHMWSMAVQGQFYLAVILLCAMVIRPVKKFYGEAKAKTVAYTMFGAIAIASFAYANSDVEQTLNYYSSFSRAWELMLGGLIALAIPLIPRDFAHSKTVSIAMSAFGLAAISLTGLLVDGTNTFPGWEALLPIGGTVALVIAGHINPTRVQDVLASKPMVRLGGMAFSLYLWHWPLYILSLSLPITQGRETLTGVIIVALSLVLAYFTSRLVESRLRQSYKPVRYRKGPISYAKIVGRRQSQTDFPQNLVVLVVIAFMVIATAPISGKFFHNWNEERKADIFAANAGEYPGAMALLNGAEAKEGVPIKPSLSDFNAMMPITSKDQCFQGFEDTTIKYEKKNGDPCVYGDTNSDFVVAAIGGSHTEYWMDALDKIGKENHFAIRTYMKAGCPVTVGGTEQKYDGSDYKECTEWNEKVMEKLKADKPNLVFTTSTRPSDIVGHGPDGVPDMYINMWRELRSVGIPIAAVRDNPWMIDDNGAPFNAVDCLGASGGSGDTCGVPRDKFGPRDDPAPAAAAAASLDGITFMDLTNGICNDDYCPAVVGNVVVYRDSHHLTNAYVDTLKNELWRQLAPAVNSAR